MPSRFVDGVIDGCAEALADADALVEALAEAVGMNWVVGDALDEALDDEWQAAKKRVSSATTRPPTRRRLKMCTREGYRSPLRALIATSSQSLTASSSAPSSADVSSREAP